MIRWLVWSLYLVAWTIALEVPIRVPSGAVGAELILTYRVLVAKTIHVAAFAGLAMLSAWVDIPSRLRPALVFFLLSHALATEIWQTALEPYCHRGGSLSDVALDFLGIALGMLLTWKRWSRHDHPPEANVPTQAQDISTSSETAKHREDPDPVGTRIEQ